MRQKLNLGAGILIMLLTLSYFQPSFAQKKSKEKPSTPAQQPAAPKADTTKARSAGGLKPYSQVITAKAKSQRGLFTVHKVNDDYFF